MNNNFINYSDFLSISLETLETAPRKLFEKMIQMINSTLHQQVVELEKQALQIDVMTVIPVHDLEEYYDVTLDAIEDVKLFKKSISQIEKKDILFSKLNNTVNSLHEAYVNHMDRMGQLEIRILSKEKSA